MAHIFKHPKEDSKGIVVISHQEAERGLNHYSDMMNRIGEEYIMADFPKVSDIPVSLIFLWEDPQ